MEPALGCSKYRWPWSARSFTREHAERRNGYVTCQRAPGYIDVDGQRFDRSLVELARELQAAKKGGGMLGKAEAAKLLADARDGPGVTETERETLRWVCASFGMTRAARSYLLEQCAVPAGWVVK